MQLASTTVQLPASTIRIVALLAKRSNKSIIMMHARNESAGLASNSSLTPRMNHEYFTDFTWRKFVLYSVAAAYVLLVGIVSLIEPFLDFECSMSGETLQFSNPAFDGSPCQHIRYPVLLGFSREECAFCRRLVASCLLGGLIGWERRQADRPAGIRTMSLVSLGSCLFTINSSNAFLNGPMSWDASRVSAAIPSGVGFLGAGLIFKKEEINALGDSSHVVHGLTTAASLWLSAAVGIACGGDLYMPASFGVAIMLLLLRFGPRGSGDLDDEEEDDDEDDKNHEAAFGEETSLDPERYHNSAQGYSAILKSPNQMDPASIRGQGRNDSLRKSMRKRQAALASVV